jgi:hypothetical protein
MINWEEFGRSQLARTVLNLSQLGRREASDLAFHRKAVARKMTGPHSHRGGHWFDPSIAHQVSGYVGLYQRSRWGAIPVARAGTLPAMAGRRGWGEDSIYFDRSGECRDLRPIGIVRAAGVA